MHERIDVTARRERRRLVRGQHRRRRLRRARAGRSPRATARTTCSRGPAARACQVPLTKDRPSEAKYFVPPADRAAPVHVRRDAGHRVPRHRCLRAPDRRGRDRRGEGRLLQPAGHPARPHRDRRHRAVRRAVHARPRGCGVLRRARRRPVRLRPGRRRRLRARRRARACDNVFVGVGWRGTGYKFAPWIGRVLFELALQGGTVYDVHRFDPPDSPPPQGILHDPSVRAHLRPAPRRRRRRRRRGLRLRARTPRLREGRPVRARGHPRRTRTRCGSCIASSCAPART